MDISNVQRVSATLDDEGLAGVNETCHSYAGSGVTSHSKPVIRHPRVVVIAWAHFYHAHPAVVTAGVQLLTDLVDGGYLSGLAQYGVARGTVLGSVTIDTDSAHPAPATIDKDPLRDQLIDWLRAGTVSPAPATNEQSLVYFIFPDPSTTLSLGTTTGFCGYHHHGKFNGASDHDDLYFAALSTNGRTETGTDFMQRISFCASHELGEAVTNPDDGGWFDGACEIGDICETKGTYTYRDKWTVEQFWSNWDKDCIRGDRGVSLRRFAQAMNASSASLRSLGMPNISIETVASRFP